MVGPEDQLASLIRSLVVLRLVTVCFLKFPALYSADLITPLAEF